MMIYRAPRVSLSERSEALAKGVSIVKGRGNDNVTIFIDISGLELLPTAPFSDEYWKQSLEKHCPEISMRVHSVSAITTSRRLLTKSSASAKTIRFADGYSRSPASAHWSLPQPWPLSVTGQPFGGEWDVDGFVD